MYFEEDDWDEVNWFQKEFQLKWLDWYNNIETQMSLFFSEINQTIEQRDVSTNTQESQSIFLQTVENDRRVILENIIYFFEEYWFNTDWLIYEKKIYKHSDNIEKMIKFKSSWSIFFFVSVENDIWYKNWTIYYPLSNSENLSKIKENF